MLKHFLFLLATLKCTCDTVFKMREREKKKKSKRVRTWTHCRWALKNISSKKQRHRVNESSLPDMSHLTVAFFGIKSDERDWNFTNTRKAVKREKMCMMPYLLLCATQTVHRCQRMLRRQKLLPAFASTCIISIKLNGICLFFQTRWGQRGGCRSIGRMEPN